MKAIDLIRRLGQIGFFILVSKGMNEIVSLFRLPIPGSILGMLLVFVLLLVGIIRLDWIDAGANWLLAEMLLFFIPSAVGVLPYKNLLLSSGLQIGAVILGSTLMVMVCSGYIAQGITKWKERRPS
ncbi:CidA/LrgA family protein [Paenibacillus hamazuiensis]|uniref:CidA/LrgA family protein n=1 Tax=Paenibacillus hamazuiensis TaxID=2936508 RepID=UPI00200C6B48|nr:CidA/LrgA family holin-like protein [Paenibacillus hamazuiensis]